MADLNLKVGDFVRLRRGDVVGPLIQDGHLHYPWSIADKPHLCWTSEGRWEEGSFSSKLNPLDIVAVHQTFAGGAEEPKEADDPDKVHFDLYRGQTVEDGVIRLTKWPEGYVLWYHGQIVWKSWKPIKPETQVMPGLRKVDIFEAVNRARNHADRNARWGSETVLIADEIMKVLGEHGLSKAFDPKPDTAPKCEGGLSEAAAAEPMRLFALDDIEPVTRAFLQSLYPSAPLRAIEVHYNCSAFTTIEVSFGRPMNVEKTIYLNVTSSVPVWVK